MRTICPRSGGYCAQVHEKLVPSVESAEHADVCGLLDELVLLISIVSTAGKLPIAPVVEESVAKLVPAMPELSLPNRTVPKSANGSMPPPAVQQGASVIHSADDRSAPLTVPVLVKYFSVVLS